MKKILIIEDDLVLSEMYAKKLRKSSYQVEECYDGLSGLSRIGEFNPDLILLDIMMPNMNGLETLESIKSQTSSNSKIFILSNISDKKKIKLAMQRGADDYIVKSDSDPSDVVEKINNKLRQESKQKENKKIIYVKPGLNKFRIKNPNGGNDIEMNINIKL